MYGYVRPLKSELRVREYELFQAAYCGLCEALRERYGAASRFVVNYDLTFLAMVLADGGETQLRRCPAHPLKERPCVCRNPSFDDAADYSVILAYWKLMDAARDESAGKAAASKAAAAAVRPAWRKASERKPYLAAQTEALLKELDGLEQEKCSSLDRTADCFARILQAAAETTEDKSAKRVQQELLYHVGRTVYILDAVDDLRSDAARDRYNPLRYRLAITDGALSDEQKQELRSTLNVSQRRAAAAMELRKRDLWQPVLENIVLDGLPTVTDLVFAGKWNAKDKKKDKPFG
ncbi:MAG: hypothetical protein IJT62_04925 [Oscillospiraceae bacterium]|nr:hypothetical protein [Oscillospiraceae bacterium]